MSNYSNYFSDQTRFYIDLYTVLLTYLIGHNNPINGFRPAATHPSRRFCSLRAYASWLHQSMTGFLRFGLSNGCKVVLFADFRRSPHQIPVSPKHPPPYERHGSRWILIRCTTSISLRSSYSSLLNRMRKSLPTRTGPKILRRPIAHWDHNSNCWSCVWSPD